MLFVLNLTSLGTFFLRKRENKTENTAIVLDENSQNPLTGSFFRQTLGFSNAQMDRFREAHRSFQFRANHLIFEMDSLKSEMFKELNNSSPDTLRLNNLSDQVGSRHAELKKITNHFYLILKEVCDSTQCEELQQAFLPLFRDNTLNMGRGYHRNDSPRTEREYRYRTGKADSVQ